MKAVIVGGSMAGLFAAALLIRDGHEVVVLERSHGQFGRGAGLVAQPEVFDLMKAVGRGDVAEKGVTARERIFLDRSGAIVGRLAQPQMQTSWDALYGALRDVVGAQAYRTRQPVSSAWTEGDRAGVVLEDGAEIEADLVIGADGMGSVVRQAVLLQAPSPPRYAGYVAWRALIDEAALNPVAAAVLSERFAFYDAPGEQVLGYLVAGPDGEIEPGRRRYNAVWYRQADLDTVLVDREGLRRRASLPPGALSATAIAGLKADADALLPPAFASIFAEAAQPFVQAIFDMEAPRMARGRLVLMGDAAFVARPHTAMGVAKAAGDAMALVRATREGALAPALEAYEHSRMAAGRTIVAYGRRLGASLSLDATP